MLAGIRSLIIKATEGAPPDEIEDLAKLESRIGALPVPYRSLLLEYGAFTFDGFAGLQGSPIDDLSLMTCYGASGNNTIMELYAEAGSAFGDRWVPFADDEYGSFYGWDRNDGTIWFFDSEAGFASQQIFPSMQSFLDAIFVEPF